MYGIYTRIIKSSQCNEKLFRWNDAIHAVEDSEREDKIRIAIAVGIAIGKHQERERRKPKTPIIESVEIQWEGSRDYRVAMDRAFDGENYDKASCAVAKVFGNDDALVMAASEIEIASFRAGFARALQMFAEAKQILEERQ